MKKRLEIVAFATEKAAAGLKDFANYRGLGGAVNEIVDEARKKHGGFLQVIISLPVHLRSTGYKSQNHAINGYCKQLSVELGMDFAVVKFAMKRLAFNRGYPFMHDKYGDIVISPFDGEPVPESETKISVEQAAMLIDTIKQFAAEHSIRLEEGER